VARLDPDTGRLTITLVVTGPRRGGKSTLLRTARSHLPADRLRTMADREPPVPLNDEAMLDWLPLDLGHIGGREVQVDFYAVSGSRAYDNTRRLLLHDADGLLVVLDSQAARLDDNLVALRELQDELLDRDGDLRDLPRVFCYAKQDLPEELLLTQDALDDALNFRAAPSFAADLVRGRGVLESLHALVTLTLRRLGPTPQSGS
jgi:signal recognition particle receptor subunit beta